VIKRGAYLGGLGYIIGKIGPQQKAGYDVLLGTTTLSIRPSEYKKNTLEKKRQKEGERERAQSKSPNKEGSEKKECVQTRVKGCRRRIGERGWALCPHKKAYLNMKIER
jgi:hypothetical protein